MHSTEHKNKERDISARRDKIDLLGLPVDSHGLRVPDDLNRAISSHRPFLVTFLNPYSYHVAKKDSTFIEMLSKFEHISCDGVGLVVAARLCLKKPIPRQAFDTTSVALPVFQWAAEHDKPLILVGGKPGVANSAAKKLLELVPDLTIADSYSGYGDGPIRARQHAESLVNSLVVCGMGAPLQEEFLVSLKRSRWRGLGFTCGGFLDQLINSVDYYPGWINRMNLRFAYRLYKEPRRLWRRYLVEYQVFVGKFLKALVTG
jgi:N-acetylglucosaminyldiphosphoundecaprenol N-acetyl-beta-D-mannosaminyltransferase